MSKNLANVTYIYVDVQISEKGWWTIEKKEGRWSGVLALKKELQIIKMGMDGYYRFWRTTTLASLALEQSDGSVTDYIF